MAMALARIRRTARLLALPATLVPLALAALGLLLFLALGTAMLRMLGTVCLATRLRLGGSGRWGGGLCAGLILRGRLVSHSRGSLG